MPGLFNMPDDFDINYVFQNEFPSCCGIDVLVDFCIDPSPLHLLKTDKALGLRMKGDEPNSIMLVALNDIQRKHYDKMLKQHGFRVLLANAYHPGHGSKITLYGWQKYHEGDKLPPAQDPEIYDIYR